MPMSSASTALPSKPAMSPLSRTRTSSAGASRRLHTRPLVSLVTGRCWAKTWVWYILGAFLEYMTAPPPESRSFWLTLESFSFVSSSLLTTSSIGMDSLCSTKRVRVFLLFPNAPIFCGAVFASQIKAICGTPPDSLL